MRPRTAWLWLLPSLCSCLDVSTEKPTPYFIITCNESRTPDEMIYLQDGGDGDSALQAWKMDYRSPADAGKFLLYPGEEEEHYYLVGAYESHMAGFMLYLDNSGQAQAWPFDPENPDKEAEWRIIPFDKEKKDKENTFFIVSGKNAAYPGEMLYPSGFLGAFDTWHYDKKKPDVQATFAFYPAPPSPPIDFDAVRETHERMVLVFNIIIPIVFIVGCLCIYTLRNRTRVYAKDTGFTASIFALPGQALMNMPWNQRYQKPGVGAADGEGTRGGYSSCGGANLPGGGASSGEGARSGYLTVP